MCSGGSDVAAESFAQRNLSSDVKEVPLSCLQSSGGPTLTKLQEQVPHSRLENTPLATRLQVNLFTVQVAVRHSTAPALVTAPVAANGA